MRGSYWDENFKYINRVGGHHENILYRKNIESRPDVKTSGR